MVLTDYQVVNTLLNHSSREFTNVAAIQWRVECTLMEQKKAVEEEATSDGWREQQEHRTKTKRQHP